MRREVTAVLLAIAAIGSLPGTVIAQTSVPQDTMPGSPADSARPAPLPARIVTGTRFPARIRDLVYGASVLGRDGLRREPVLTGAAALTRLPSVSIDEGAGVGGPTVLRLRGGEESFTLVMFDGTPLNLTGGFLDLQGITLTNVERVEVARGPQSVMYGSSAMSGAVQFITREGRPGPARLALRAEGGGAGPRGGQGQAEVLVDGGTSRLRYSLGAGGTAMRGIYALPHDLRTWDGSTRVDARVGTAWQLTAAMRYMETSSMLPVRNAGVTRAPLDPNQHDGHQRLLMSADARLAPGGRWSHQFTAQAYRVGFTYEDEADGLVAADYPFFVFDFDFGLHSVQWRKTAQYVGTWTQRADGPAGMTLAFGGRAEREDLTVEQSGAFGDSRSAFSRSSGSLFAELQTRLAPRVDVVAGVRAEQIESLAGAVVPRAGIRVSLVPDRLSFRASAGRAFKAPNLEQQFLVNPFVRANPDLKPELSTSWEIGITGESPTHRLMATGGFFRQTYDDLMRLVQIDTSGNRQNRNVGQSLISGVELELAKSWGERWQLSAGGSWLHTEMVDNDGLAAALYPQGSALPAVPRWTANVVLDGGLTSLLSASLRLRAVGAQEVFTERFGGARATLDSYMLVGFTLRAPVAPHAEIYLRGENLLGAPYAVAYDRPGIPRTIAAGVRLDY